MIQTVMEKRNDANTQTNRDTIQEVQKILTNVEVSCSVGDSKVLT